MGNRKANSSKDRYSKIKSIDGTHPFQETLFTYVPYKARSKKGGKISYFNFSLAKEMGLIENDHIEALNNNLETALLDTFSLTIINEYDILNNKSYKKADIRNNDFMATRYLQLQHPGRTGVMSGDGRSIWNGFFQSPKNKGGKIWDISSCGTGATCLSPATALAKKFFETGDPDVSYGCGLNSLQEGFVDVVFSEILHSQGIETERILCVIEYSKKLSITVRVGENLLRPSHFFNHLKQSQLARLRSVMEYHFARESNNGYLKSTKNKNRQYSEVTKKFAHDFADAVARFEEEYLFCWLDWDGDNVLMNGGIIDYGSVRMFGLFHHRYRFKDTEKWSSNIKEQRKHGRKTVQTFAQACDYAITGVKKPLDQFLDCEYTRIFDEQLIARKRFFLLRRLGLDESMIESTIKKINENSLERFEKIFYRMQSLTSSNGEIEVPDGVTTPALLNMRAFLRELPVLLKGKKNNQSIIEELYGTIHTVYAEEESDQKLERILGELESCLETYLGLIAEIAKVQKCDASKIFQIIRKNVVHLHPIDRITGDSIFIIGQMLTDHSRKLGFSGIQKVISEFIASQAKWSSKVKKPLNAKETKLLDAIKEVAFTYREGL